MLHHQRVVMTFGFSFCLLTCGVTLAIGRGGGLFWLPVAYVSAITQAERRTHGIFAVEVRRDPLTSPTQDRPIVSKQISRSRD